MAIVGGFTPVQTAQLTGLSRRQLERWARTGVYKPSLANASRAYGRIYSVRDVVALRALAMMRGKVTLQQIRHAGAWLQRHVDIPWSSLRFSLCERELVLRDAATGAPLAVWEREPEATAVELGSIAHEVPERLEVELESIAREVVERLQLFQRRQPNHIGRVARNRFVEHNDAVVEGTRIPTQVVWDYHEAGYDTCAILELFPGLTAQDIEAAVAFEQRHLPS